MGKTIRFNENGLIAIKKRLNEIMVGTDGVSHNDVYGNVKLYHGTDILALVAILKTNRVCASEGRQHGETHGMNWFSLKNDGSFNKGACFSIEVPENELNNVFQKMNSVHVISRESCLDISRYNPQVEYFCGHTRETLNNYYNIITKKGEKYPIEQIRDEIFYRWCEESGNEETFMSVGDYDFGIIMANILGDDAVRKEGFIDESVGKEFAPVATIGDGGNNPPVGGNHYGIEQENVDQEVSSSEVDLSSFKKRDTLPPGIWKNEEILDSRVRLKLLDIADDFWEYLNLSWVEPKGIIITGSICNFNWSKFSDIDLHIIADFKEIDEKTEFVKQYLDSKKNEWNNEHEGLKIMGFPVELYVQDVDDSLEAGGIYDLEENAWIRKPNPHSIKSIGLNKFSIKDKAAEIMTIIDDMYGKLSTTTDDHEVDQIGEDAHYLWDKVKDLRKKSLNKNGESGSGNIVYKVLRRTGYLDRLFKLFSRVYDRSNSITESRELIREYLDSDHNLPLYKYFKWVKTASDADKAEDLMYCCSYGSKKYLGIMSREYPELEEMWIQLKKDESVWEDDEFISRYAEVVGKYNMLQSMIQYLECNEMWEDLPSWLTMDFNRIVKNEWCIHFCYDANSIMREGFKWGTDDINRLALTGAGRKKWGEGYNFAYPIGEARIDTNNYGSFDPENPSQRGNREAVIFQTSGVEVDHYGDNERQVVFWGPSAKNFIPIRYNSEIGEWCIYGKNDQVLKAGEPSEILDWVLTNLPQYRKQIMAGKNGFIPTHYDYQQKKRVPYPLYKNESVKKYLKVLKEEVALDGSTEDNPYEKRWKAEREALKSFVANYGKLMQSKEDNKGGKLYKVYYDETMSNLIGYNYCICVQWNEQEMKPGSTVYIRALDKFTPFIRRNLQFDTRGRDNMRGTYDDTGY